MPSFSGKNEFENGADSIIRSKILIHLQQAGYAGAIHWGVFNYFGLSHSAETRQWVSLDEYNRWGDKVPQLRRDHHPRSSSCRLPSMQITIKAISSKDVEANVELLESYKMSINVRMESLPRPQTTLPHSIHTFTCSNYL
ncbi:hypothetical protein O181_082130 [Austropuccinia psidii MF-1]|uniref:Uncharacterized protein n=1 Tax=Austropuccinia psidii MF-1 TaxID=1389203 RepID=A0A9Q3FKF3_9BASI|nr:hypothetical protein [Austropuccinia psidii MF-1]